MRQSLNILFISIFAALLGACASQANTKDETVLDSYHVFNPAIIDTTYNTDYVADISAIKNVEIRSRVKGYLEAIHVDEGQRVQKGQLLFSLSNLEYKEELLKAKSNYTSALAEMKAMELALRNSEMLFNNEVVSEMEVEMDRAKLAAAKAQVEVAKSMEIHAQLNLSYTQIKAPFSGIINRIDYKIGSLVDESTLMTTLSDDSEVFAYFNVSEKEYLEYINAPEKYADAVKLILANGKVHIVDGKIETMEGEFDNVTGNISFRAKFKNPDFMLRHGSSGKVRLTRTLNDVMIIPQKSAFEIQDKIFVYTVDAANTVKMQSFKTSMRLPHLYVVASGITEKDLLVYEGIQELKQGQTVQPVKSTLQALMASQSSILQ